MKNIIKRLFVLLFVALLFGQSNLFAMCQQNNEQADGSKKIGFKMSENFELFATLLAANKKESDIVVYKKESDYVRLFSFTPPDVSDFTFVGGCDNRIRLLLKNGNCSDFCLKKKCLNLPNPCDETGRGIFQLPYELSSCGNYKLLMISDNILLLLHKDGKIVGKKKFHKIIKRAFFKGRFVKVVFEDDTTKKIKPEDIKPAKRHDVFLGEDFLQEPEPENQRQSQPNVTINLPSMPRPRYRPTASMIPVSAPVRRRRYGSTIMIPGFSTFRPAKEEMPPPAPRRLLPVGVRAVQMPELPATILASPLLGQCGDRNEVVPQLMPQDFPMFRPAKRKRSPREVNRQQQGQPEKKKRKIVYIKIED